MAMMRLSKGYKMDFLKGYKTKIAALGLLALAIAAAIDSEWGQAAEYATQALGVFGIRMAVGRGGT